MPDMTEIKGLVEKVNEALVPLRAEVDSIKAAQRDVVTETKFDKMAAQVTEAMEKLQAIEQKNAAIEAAFARRDAGNVDGAKELEAKGREALQEFKAGRDRGDLEIRAMATLHPAYLLRSPIAKRLAWRDFLAIKKALA